MFCVMRKTKVNDGTGHKFYLSERERIQGKVSSKDIFIITLSYHEMANSMYTDLKNKITEISESKNISKEHTLLVINKMQEMWILIKKVEDDKKAFEERFKRAEKREQREQHEKSKERDTSEQWKRFDDMCSGTSKCNYTEEQKEYLRIIYKAGAMKLHSDITGGSDEAMKFLNKLKQDWGI